MRTVELAIIFIYLKVEKNIITNITALNDQEN